MFNLLKTWNKSKGHSENQGWQEVGHADLLPENQVWTHAEDQDGPYQGQVAQGLCGHDWLDQGC